MREITLLTSKIFCGSDVLSKAGAAIRGMSPKARNAFVLTDRNCLRYARTIARGLEAAGLETEVHGVPPGESKKSLATAASLYDALARAGADRKTPLVAVGGGVITDLGGFVAATYMRGIPAFLAPTTLLGQVDAAIGGKTGVNLPHGKNLVGTFTQPAGVFLDPLALATLPAREYVAGLGEVVKYGMIRDAELFAAVERGIDSVRARDPEALEEIVHRCAAIKADVVGQDEREQGLRAILNFGHTIGHAIEAGLGYGAWLHGEGVACGMVLAADLSHRLGLMPAAFVERLRALIERAGLPVQPPKLGAERYLQLMRVDKKAEAGAIRFVLIEALGRAGLHAVPDALITETLTAHGAA